MSDREDSNTEYPANPYSDGPHLLPLPKATLNSLMLDRMDAITLKVDNVDNNLYAVARSTATTLARYQALLYVFIALSAANFIGIMIVLAMLSFLAGHVR